METFAVVFHVINALIFLGIGVYCTGRAAQAAARLGITLSTPRGATDFRATYGGMCLAVGLFFLIATFRRSIPLESASWLALLSYLGLGVTRLYGVITERPTTRPMIAFVMVELAMAGLSAWLLIEAAQPDL